MGNREIKRLEKDYKDKGYGDFKKDLADVVVKFLSDFQDRYNGISDKDVIKILEEGRKKAEKLASAKLEKVKNSIGIK